MGETGAILGRQFIAAKFLRSSCLIAGFFMTVLLMLSLVNISTAAAQTPVDVNPPTLLDFSFTPTTIDTSESAASITANMRLMDSGSGVCISTCFDHSSPTQVRFQHAETGQFQDGLFELTSGSLVDGTFSGPITFPQGSASGVWTVSQILLADGVGNREWQSTEQLASQGFLTTLTKTSGSPAVTTQVPSASTNEFPLMTPVPGIGTTNDTDTIEVSEAKEASGSQNTSYTRFEVHQQSREPLAGDLLVKIAGTETSVPYSVAANERFSLSSLFEELTGRYELKMTLVGRDEPILWVDGDLQKVGFGEYRHQFINGDADPDLLVLTPDDAGMVIALGSIKARLNSCISLYSPTEAVFDLGVDTNGDGVVDPSESVTRVIQGASNACLTTPESNIPLTSLYSARVVTDQGTILAENNGLYDFLNRSSVDSKKQALPELVREFSVQWIRTPVAASVEVLNSSLRPPSVQVSVVPEKEDTTADVILNDSDDSDMTPADTDGASDSNGEDSSIEGSDPFGFLIDNLLWIGLVLGVVVAGFGVLQLASSGPVSYHDR
jgi:hypothetical protein